MPLDRKKLAVLHVGKTRLGIVDDDWRALLGRVAGVASSRDLDDSGFVAVMTALEAAGFKSDFAKRHGGNLRLGMANAGQVALIRALWSEYTDGEGDDRSLGKWLGRWFKVSSIRFLPADKAPKAITALKAMKAKKAAKETADA